MALVLSGKVVALAPDAEDEVFRGRVFIGDDGLVDTVTKGTRTAAPAGFAGAPTVDMGDAFVYPGFVDLHSHIGYNTLPLWADPDRTRPYAHHDSWPGGDSYKNEITWPAWTLLNGAPESVLAYVQVRALAGGTTTIQGWPTTSRSSVNNLVRSVDNEQVGTLSNPVVVSALTLDSTKLQKQAKHLKEGRVFVYHCAEGGPGTVVTGEFEDLLSSRCVRAGLVAVHCTALDADAFRRWHLAGKGGGAVVWSPFSNLWLYGVTTDIPAARQHGVPVCLGTDWGPSGTKNLLGEIKVAKAWSKAQRWGLTDADLVRMITTNPGDALAHAWGSPVGRLVPGALADVTVLARRKSDPWANVVAAQEPDVRFVVVRGKPKLGTKALMQAAGAGATTPVRIGNTTRHVPLRLPDGSGRVWPWADVLRRLEKVRASAKRTPPRGPSALRGDGPAAAADFGGGDPPGTPPMAVTLDMPLDDVEAAGPPPPGRTVDVPPIDTIHHSPDWLTTIAGRGFHSGALDALAKEFK